MLTHHDQVITLDPLLPWGYEMKHAALHKAGDFDNAVDTLETMLSKIAESPDPVVRRELYPCHHGKDDLFTCSIEYGDKYISRSSKQEAIRRIV